jgi:cbb3-type cytochrome oxidase subunit 3
MLKEIITPTGSVLPLIALVMFFGIALLVIIYIVTDRRRGHRSRMESMPLDDGTPVTKDGKDQP